MQKFVRRHQKKFLALFTVGLMITFAISSGNKTTNRGRNETVIAQSNDGPVYGADKEQAEQEWRLLQRNLGRYLINALMVPPPSQRLEQISEQQALNLNQKFEENPQTFFLMAREARKAGVRADGSEYQYLTEQAAPNVGTEDDDTQALFHNAVTDLLLIRANFQRLASNIKLSQPAIENSLASNAQSMKLDVLPIAASDFASKIPPPTTQQVDDQFKRFANVDPNVPDPTGNPFGFGYRLPQRVKLQYFKIDRASAEAAVDARKSAYDWDVDARKYYYSHLDEFPSTQPSSTQPSSQPQAQPYAQVREQVLKAVKDAQVDPLMAQAQNRLTTMLNTDWRAWSSSTSTTAPATNPSASTNASYPTYMYMRKPAKAVYDEFHVTVEPNELANASGHSYLSESDLASQFGIGSALLNPRDQSSTFPRIVMQQVSNWLKLPDHDTPAAYADLLKPSQPLEDSEGNIYIYRITNARPAEPPASVQEVASQIDADLRKAAGYKLAQESATQLLTNAKTTNLKSAANGKAVFSIDTRTMDPTVIGLAPQDTNQFITQANQLLGQYNPKTNLHPTMLIDLPTEGKVYIAQLTGVSAPWSRDNYADFYGAAVANLRYGLELKLQEDWYGHADERNGYKPTNPKNPAS